MGTNNKIKKEDILSMYIDFVLENCEEPKTVYKFCKENKFEEAIFYENFASIQMVKASVFSNFFKKTHDLLHQSEDYKSFDARNQLLSFYFTFFELLTANRSYVSFVLQDSCSNLDALKALKGLRADFKNYVNTLEIETFDVKQEQLEQLKLNIITESAWSQLLLTLKFWLEDTSVSFEKTDVLIEKSVNASFDVLNILPLKSVIDLGKFLFKEKMTTK